jgi:hypothetical protein
MADDNDPVLVVMQRQVDGLQTILKRIDELEMIIGRLFEHIHRIDADHARLLAERPVLPTPPRPH